MLLKALILKKEVGKNQIEKKITLQKEKWNIVKHFIKDKIPQYN